MLTGTPVPYRAQKFVLGMTERQREHFDVLVLYIFDTIVGSICEFGFKRFESECVRTSRGNQRKYLECM